MNDEERQALEFDPQATAAQGAIGWVVDEVDQVVPVDPDAVDASPLDDEAIEGIVKREDTFVI